MQIVLDLILPLFGVVLAGFAAAKVGVFGEAMEISNRRKLAFHAARAKPAGNEDRAVRAGNDWGEASRPRRDLRAS